MVYRGGSESKQDKPAEDLISGFESRAELARRRIWEIPKETLPMLRTKRELWETKDNFKRVTDLVVCKSKDAEKALRNARRELASSTVSVHKKWVIDHLRAPNFGRDVLHQMNRGG
ncbi:unnamed protein product, partial [Prorocentrum cordatum]